ncbi:hypothetical protein [Thermococcus alcaliphilus]|uniref:hypothetical protein n=1 Tax=Thermococcus alcaliphilus TaxID=139207 RepID=UPI002091DFAC|nr:hypothetical protein [Thermococcus alcaliphilus]MCO6040634.1 hypothetical protein [Thermococcus alcaliphilus]
MLRWVVLGIVGLLVFNSFGFVFAQEVKSLQVSSETCSACSSCQDFDIDKALSEANAKIENLTRLINQKEAELHKLYAELNKTKSVETLEKIIEMRNELRPFQNMKMAFERQRLSLELVKKYTRRTPYGVEVLYYRLPREDELVKQYIEKVHPVRKDVDLDWFIAYYRQAEENTFYEYSVMNMQLKNMVKEGIVDIQDALDIIKTEDKLWDKIYSYLEEKTKLETLKRLKTIGRKQTIMKTMGIEPLYINYGGISERYGNCPISPYSPYKCGDNYLTETLPAHDSGISVTFIGLQPVALWVGMYTVNPDNTLKYIGEYCRYSDYFKPENKLHEFFDIARSYDSSTERIQIKYFYSGQAYNPYTGSYQKAVLIWQFDCDEGGCFLTSYNPHLPDPNNPTYIPYVYTTLLRVDWYNLYDNCCYGPDNPECNWANGHCYGCFAPDDSASQNFAWVDRVGWEPIPQS